MLKLYTTGALVSQFTSAFKEKWQLVPPDADPDVMFVHYSTQPSPMFSRSVKAFVTNMSNPVWPNFSPFGRPVFTTLDIPAKIMKLITPTIEHTWGLIHAAHRRLPAVITAPLYGDRSAFMAPKMLSRSTIGIIGLGRIGAGVEEIADAFGMRVLVCDPKVNNLRPLDIAKEADVLVCCASRAGNERPIITKDVLSCMPDGSVFVSTAYGDAVDIDALIEALSGCRLRCAALDILPASLTGEQQELIGHLRQAGRLIITPHIGGSTIDARRETELAVLDLAAQYIGQGMAERMNTRVSLDWLSDGDTHR